MSDLHPALIPWIDALAQADAEDYLRSQAALQADSSEERTKPVPLPGMDKAA